MTRPRLVRTFGCVLALAAAFGCGDDDSASAADGGAAGSPPPAPSTKLSALTASEVEGLCAELLGPVKAASTPEQLCTQGALEDNRTPSTCETAKKECLSDKTYPDYSKAKCADFTSSTVPKFDCDMTVADVKSCYAKTATWLKSLNCSQAANSPDAPACGNTLDKDCDFGLSKLIEPGTLPVCDMGDYQSCTCSGGAKGTQRCNASGMYDVCVCGDMPTNGTFECKAGSKSYPYDFGGGPACNQCAVNHCCQSHVDCQNDTACACYWKCLENPDESDCKAACQVSDIPDAFIDHAVCLSDNCAAPCDIKP